MVVRDACPLYRSNQYKKNSYARHGKQHHQCKACDHQCVATAENPIIAPAQRPLIAPLLCERLALRGYLSRGGHQAEGAVAPYGGTLCSLSHSLTFRVPASPTDVCIQQLEAEADEMWSFVNKKANKPWIWIALAVKTRQIIAFHVGDRSRDSAKELWANIPFQSR